jgi:hypothetical protein
MLPYHAGFAVEPVHFDLYFHIFWNQKSMMTDEAFQRFISDPLLLKRFDQRIVIKKQTNANTKQNITSKLKVMKCGKCATCSQADCGRCINCRDKPKFNGPGVRKKSCVLKEHCDTYN